MVWECGKWGKENKDGSQHWEVCWMCVNLSDLVAVLSWMHRFCLEVTLFFGFHFQ